MLNMQIIRQAREELARHATSATSAAVALDHFLGEEPDPDASDADAPRCENCQKPTVSGIYTSDDVRLCVPCFKAIEADEKAKATPVHTTAPAPADVAKPRKQRGSRRSPQPAPLPPVIAEPADAAEVTSPETPGKAKAAAGSYDEPTARCVAAHPGLHLTEIARKLKADVSTIHTVLKRLVAAKRIVREGGGYHVAETAE